VRISVVGAGYAGLVTAACLAEFGHDVACIDSDVAKIELLSAGTAPIYEPGLDDLLHRTSSEGRLRFSTENEGHIQGSKVVFIVVGTPGSSDRSADVSQVMTAVDGCAPYLDHDATVVMKSTVPVGTTRLVGERLMELRPDAGITVASNPEFLRQGSAVGDFVRPDRLVVGIDTARAEERLRQVYQPILQASVPAVFTTIESAELIKYASNAFLATKLSFINEIADLCEASGASIDEVAHGLGLDPRIGPSFLKAGPGFGGACLPKDTNALLHTIRSHGTGTHVVSAALEANRDRVARMVAKIAHSLDRPLQASRLGVLGITFKANTDDVRESPAVEIVNSLVDSGATVRLYDPQGMDRAKSVVRPSIEFAVDAYDTMDGADGLVILTEWSEFGTLDLDAVRSRLVSPVIIDLRNLYEQREMAAAGFRYSSVGRVSPAP
jgi:UDPglucose 6-dehydrogenase